MGDAATSAAAINPAAAAGLARIAASLADEEKQRAATQNSERLATAEDLIKDWPVVPEIGIVELLERLRVSDAPPVLLVDCRSENERRVSTIKGAVPGID